MPSRNRPPATATTAATVMSTTRQARPEVAAMTTTTTPAPTVRAVGTVRASSVVSQTWTSGSPTHQTTRPATTPAASATRWVADSRGVRGPAPRTVVLTWVLPNGCSGGGPDVRRHTPCHHRPRSSTPFAGMTRIRFEGLRLHPHSQRSRAPLSWLRSYTRAGSPARLVTGGGVGGLGDAATAPRTRRHGRGVRDAARDDGRAQRSLPPSHGALGLRAALSPRDCCECAAVVRYVRMCRRTIRRCRGTARVESHRYGVGGARRGRRTEGAVRGLEARDG